MIRYTGSPKHKRLAAAVAADLALFDGTEDNRPIDMLAIRALLIASTFTGITYNQTPGGCRFARSNLLKLLGEA